MHASRNATAVDIDTVCIAVCGCNYVQELVWCFINNYVTFKFMNVFFFLMITRMGSLQWIEQFPINQFKYPVSCIQSHMIIHNLFPLVLLGFICLALSLEKSILVFNPVSNLPASRTFRLRNASYYLAISIFIYSSYFLKNILYLVRIFSWIHYIKITQNFFYAFPILLYFLSYF